MKKKRGSFEIPRDRLRCVIFHLKSSRAWRAVYCALSSKISSFSGQCCLIHCWEERNRTETSRGGRCGPNLSRPREERASSVNSGRRKTASQQAGRPNMCPVTEKQTTYLQAVPLPPISTSQSLEMDHRHLLALSHTHWKLLCHAQHTLPAPFPSSTSPFTQSHKLCK